MNDNTNEAGVTKGKPELIRIDEGEIRSHLDQIVRGAVEETLNALLEADILLPIANKPRIRHPRGVSERGVGDGRHGRTPGRCAALDGKAAGSPGP